MTSNEAYGTATDVNRIEPYATTVFAVGESQLTDATRTADAEILEPYATTTIAISDMVAYKSTVYVQVKEDGVNTITDHCDDTIVIQKNDAYDLVNT